MADAHRLQHAGVAQLPQHQVVVKPQGQLGDAEGKKTRKDAVRDGWTTLGPKKKKLSERTATGLQESGCRPYLVGVGADALDEIGLRLTQSLHELVERGLRMQGTQGVNAEP